MAKRSLKSRLLLFLAIALHRLAAWIRRFVKEPQSADDVWFDERLRGAPAHWLELVQKAGGSINWIHYQAPEGVQPQHVPRAGGRPLRRQARPVASKQAEKAMTKPAAAAIAKFVSKRSAARFVAQRSGERKSEAPAPSIHEPTNASQVTPDPFPSMGNQRRNATASLAHAESTSIPLPDIRWPELPLRRNPRVCWPATPAGKDSEQPLQALPGNRGTVTTDMAPYPSAAPSAWVAESLASPEGEASARAFDSGSFQSWTTSSAPVAQALPAMAREEQAPAFDIGSVEHRATPSERIATATPPRPTRVERIPPPSFDESGENHVRWQTPESRWPDLPETRPQPSRADAAIAAALERRKRLDDEQRGGTWSE